MPATVPLRAGGERLIPRAYGSCVPRLLVCLLVVIAAVLGGRAVLGGGDASGPRQGRVVRVVDGDTLHVRIDGREETVRLLGIDTPELHRPGTPVECGARAAAREMQRLAAGRRVTLVPDRTQDARDRYGRLLAYVEAQAPAGLDLGEAEVRHGWASVYVYGGRAFARVGRYRAAARKARAGRTGVQRACAGDFHSAS